MSARLTRSRRRLRNRAARQYRWHTGDRRLSTDALRRTGTLAWAREWGRYV